MNTSFWPRSLRQASKGSKAGFGHGREREVG